LLSNQATPHAIKRLVFIEGEVKIIGNQTRPLYRARDMHLFREIGTCLRDGYPTCSFAHASNFQFASMRTNKRIL
jgi:hypothetical protein